MPPSNPLTAIDDIVINAIMGHALFAGLVADGRIQAFKEKIDIREGVEESSDMGKRVWIEPESSTPDWNFSSGSTQFVEKYRIGFGNGEMKLEEIRILKWMLIQALATLSGLRHPDGTQLQDVETMPLQIQSITIGSSRPERDPLSDPEEWNDEILITVTAFAPTAALAI